MPQTLAICETSAFDAAQLEIARVDVDRDGALDLVVRHQSPLNCGSHGCSTVVYLSKDGRYLEGDPPLVTVGPIYRCETSGGAGLQMTTDDRLGPCIIIK